jgi:pimeloyl-ACP methyl ester carboxylesterase
VVFRQPERDRLDQLSDDLLEACAVITWEMLRRDWPPKPDASDALERYAAPPDFGGWRGSWGQTAAVLLHSTGFVLHRIECPTIVITGDDDRIVPPINSRILARRIANAELVVLPRAGHAFPLEQPFALCDAVGRLQARCGGVESR